MRSPPGAFAGLGVARSRAGKGGGDPARGCAMPNGVLDSGKGLRATGASARERGDRGGAHQARDWAESWYSSTGGGIRAAATWRSSWELAAVVVLRSPGLHGKVRRQDVNTNRGSVRCGADRRREIERRPCYLQRRLQGKFPSVARRRGLRGWPVVLLVPRRRSCGDP